MHDEKAAEQSRPLVSNRTMDAVVALLLLGVAGIFISDSVRLGFSWREGEGPAPGYYPFYVALILAVSSVINFFSAFRGDRGKQIFVSLRPFGRVLAVLIPSIIFVALIKHIGMYVSSALFIASFMVMIGRQNILKSIAVGAAVPIVLFFMFEKWFLVPLPKGPLETWLGY